MIHKEASTSIEDEIILGNSVHQQQPMEAKLHTQRT